MPDVNVRDDGSWKAAKEIFVRDGGVWKTVKEVWVYDGGSWKKSFPADSGTQNYTTPGTYSFTVPNGIYQITTSVYAGGGGAGSSWFCGNAVMGGSGGAGGYLASQTRSVTPGETLNIVVGGGGAGGIYPGFCLGASSGSNGGSSSISGSFGSISATGGGGGGQGYVERRGDAGSPNGALGNEGFNNCVSTMPGGNNGTPYGTGGTSVCGGTGGNGGNGAVTISW